MPEGPRLSHARRRHAGVRRFSVTRAAARSFALGAHEPLRSAAVESPRPRPLEEAPEGQSSRNPAAHGTRRGLGAPARRRGRALAPAQGPGQGGSRRPPPRTPVSPPYAKPPPPKLTCPSSIRTLFGPQGRTELDSQDLPTPDPRLTTASRGAPCSSDRHHQAATPLAPAAARPDGHDARTTTPSRAPSPLRLHPPATRTKESAHQ
jgi:hypothetical protein